MGVLQIVDGIFVTVFLGKINVENEFSISLAGNEEKASSIPPCLVDQVTQRHIIARAFAHFDDFATLHNGEHLMEDVFWKGLRDSDPKSLGSGLQASTNSSNSAMVVGALNIHGLGVAAAKFIQVVGDVWYEVGVGAVGLLHYAIFVIAKAIAEILECSRAQP